MRIPPIANHKVNGYLTVNEIVLMGNVLVQGFSYMGVVSVNFLDAPCLVV